jgi:hypothetical protein
MAQGPFSIELISESCLQGYPLERILLVQYSNPQDQSDESAYNTAFLRLRNRVERAIGRLKMRFRCIDASGGALQYSPEMSCKIITTCAIISNFIDRWMGQDDEPPAGNVADGEDGDEIAPVVAAAAAEINHGRQRRNESLRAFVRARDIRRDQRQRNQRQ